MFTSSPDADETTLYAEVGRFISVWEHTEFAFARLYSRFRGDQESTEFLREYGAGKVFHDRSLALQRVAEKFFVSCCNQDSEASLATLLKVARQFADRRNEIAHGVLFNAAHWPDLKEAADPSGAVRGDAFVVIPAFHIDRYHNEELPKYAYSSKEIAFLRRNLVDLINLIHGYRASL